MKKRLRPWLLPATVFFTGACVLVIEIVAVRILSPYFGNTLFTVSSVLSVILAALSVGYVVGGKLADRKHSLIQFFHIITVSGVLVLVFYLLGLFLLPIIGFVLPISWGVLVAAFLLFMIPALFLGLLSPYAVKLYSVERTHDGVGSVSGVIFFWSTFGSITGSVLTGFVLVPYFGVHTIMLSTGMALFLLGMLAQCMLGTPARRFVARILFVCVLIAVTTYIVRATDHDAIYVRDGVYEKITVRDGVYNGRPTRFFLQDRSTSGGMHLDTSDPSDLVFPYTTYARVYRLFDVDPARALVLGGGAYSIPKALINEDDDVVVDVSEIEPGLIDIGKKYFALPETDRIRTFIQDGRQQLREATTSYDLIFSDVYYSLFSIPSHFTTQEFFRLAHERLAVGGVFVANLIGDLSRSSPSITMSVIKTFRSEFPNSYVFAADDAHSTAIQNIMLVGVKSKVPFDISTLAARAGTQPPFPQLASRLVDLERFRFDEQQLLTDAFAPTERMTAHLFRRADQQQHGAYRLDGEEMLGVIQQQLSYGPRHMSAPGKQRLRDFLVRELTPLVDTVQIQSFPYQSKSGKVFTLDNVVARVNMHAPQRVLLGTHYDTKRFVDRDGANPEKAVPGANDGASGVAVLVELARALREHNPNVGVDLVFFDGEEGDDAQDDNYATWKPLGSTYFVQHLDDFYASSSLESVIVVDMVCDKRLRIEQELSSLRSAEAMVHKIWEIGATVESSAFPKVARQEIRDDHTPFQEAGIPAALLIDFTYAPFHTAHDLPDMCSAKSLAVVGETLLQYLETLQ